MKIIALIPARLKSTRLPGKPLLKINNKTIIELVYNQAKKVKQIDNIYILTDNNKIKNCVDKFIDNDDKCVIINEECLNGTERIILYLKKYNKINYNQDTIIVNIQGDEPFINPNNIKIAINNFIEKKNTVNKLVCSTIYYKTKNKLEIKNKNRGKLVLDSFDNIIYCSRNIIPSNKTQDLIENYDYNIHIGIFVYEYNYLVNNFFKINTPLQLIEDIEWLKIIENGFKINAVSS